jgi:hypothetical protein
VGREGVGEGSLESHGKVDCSVSDLVFPWGEIAPLPSMAYACCLSKSTSSTGVLSVMTMLATWPGGIEVEREAIWECGNSSREGASAMSSKPERDNGILGWKEREPLRPFARLLEKEEESDKEEEVLMDPFKGPVIL